MESGLQIDSIYTDFKKAFDRVNHSILPNKLNNFGIHGPLLKWFESYLVDRQQIVKINNYFSRPFSPPSGVPQGSHLGPFVFLIFINDILLNVKNSKALMFADDLKLYYTIHNLNDCLRLQDDLDSILNWCNINDMQLNINKCKSITFTRKRTKINYNLNNINLDSVSEIRDLSVLFNAKVTFKSHINNVANRAFKLCGFISRQSSEFINNTAMTIF